MEHTKRISRSELEQKVVKFVEDIANELDLEEVECHTSLYGDVHGYLKLRGRDEIVHLQGYPGLSDKKAAHITARVLDYDEMQRQRANGVCVGNEHAALKRYLTNALKVSYDNAKIIARIIESDSGDKPYRKCV